MTSVQYIICSFVAVFKISLLDYLIVLTLLNAFVNGGIRMDVFGFSNELVILKNMLTC